MNMKKNALVALAAAMLALPLAPLAMASHTTNCVNDPNFESPAALAGNPREMAGSLVRNAPPVPDNDHDVWKIAGLPTTTTFKVNEEAGDVEAAIYTLVSGVCTRVDDSSGEFTTAASAQDYYLRVDLKAGFDETAYLVIVK